MKTLTKLIEWAKTRKWLIIVGLFIAAVYVATDFAFFNELIHSAIKVFAVATIGLGLRSLAFPKSLGDYVDNGMLESDLRGRGDALARSEAAERLVHYRWATTIWLAIPTLLFFLA